MTSRYFKEKVVLSFVLLLFIFTMVNGCQKKKKVIIKKKSPVETIVNNAIQTIADIEIVTKQNSLIIKNSSYGWMMEKPENVQIDQIQLKELWHMVTSLQGNPVQPYDVKKELRQQFSEADKIITISFKTQIGEQIKLIGVLDTERKRICCIKRVDPEQYFIIPKDHWFNLADWQNRLPSHYLLSFNSSTITKIEYRYEENVFAIQRNKPEVEAVWQVIDPVNQAANEEAVKILMTFLEKMKFYEVKETSIWGKMILSKYGLHKPVAQLSLWQEGKRLPKVLAFGKPDNETGMLYVKSQDETRIVSVPISLLTECQVRFEQTQIEKKLIAFMYMVKKIDFNLPGYEKRLINQKEGWQLYDLASDKINPLHEIVDEAEKPEGIIDLLNQLVYETVVEIGTSAYEYFSASRAWGQIEFYTEQDELLVRIDFYEHDEISEYLFLKRDMDGKVLAINKSALAPVYKDNVNKIR